MQNRKFWIGIGISFVLLIVFLTTSDFGIMADSLIHANYLYVAPSIMIYLLSVLFRTVRWQLMMRHIRPIPIKNLYSVVIIGYMANNLLPFRLGEIVRTYYLNQKEGVSQTSALASILIERVLDAITLLLFIAVIAQFVSLASLTEGLGEWIGIPPILLVIGFSTPFLLAMVVLIFVASRPQQAKYAISFLAGLISSRLQKTVSELIELFITGLLPVSRPMTLLKLVLLSVPIWALEAALFFLIAYSFDLDNVYKTTYEMIMAMTLVTSISNIGSSIPAAPGGIGLFELVTRETLVLLPFGEIARPIAAAFAAVTHATLLIPIIVLGQILLWRQHISLKLISFDSLKFFARSSESDSGDK